MYTVLMLLIPYGVYPCDCFYDAAGRPFAVPGQETAPPGESGRRAVKTSTPVSVTRRVCSN